MIKTDGDLCSLFGDIHFPLLPSLLARRPLLLSLPLFLSLPAYPLLNREGYSPRENVAAIDELG
jgi:hypothetical protein